MRSTALLLTFTLAAGLNLNAAERKHHTKTEWATFIGTELFVGMATFLDAHSSAANNGVVGPTGVTLYESSSLYASGPDRGFHARGYLVMWGLSAPGMASTAWFFHRHSDRAIVPEGIDGGLGVLHLIGWRHNVNIRDKVQAGWVPNDQ